MTRIQSILISIFSVCVFVLLSILYGSNQILDETAKDFLSSGFIMHYTQAISDFRENTLATLMISIPMRLWENTYAPVIFLIFLHLCSFIIMYSALKKTFSKATMAWFSIIFLLSPWFIYNTRFSFSAYVEPGVAVFFLSLIKLSTENFDKTNRFIWTFLLLFSIAWCMQFHNSWIILPIAALLTYAKRIAKFNIAGFITGGLTIVGSAALICIDSSANPTLYAGESPDGFYTGYGITHIWPVIKAVLYWFRLGSTLCQDAVLNETSFDWISSSNSINNIAQVIWYVAVYAVGTLTIIASISANYIMISNLKNKIFSRNKPETSFEIIASIIFFIFVAFIIYCLVIPYLISSKDLEMPFMFAIIPLLFLIEFYKRSALPGHLMWLSIAIGFLICMNLCSALSSDLYNANADYLNTTVDLIDNIFN